LSAIGLGILILACLTVFPPQIPLHTAFLVALASGGFIALATGRTLMDALVRQAYVHGIGLRKTVMVGSLDEVGRSIRLLRDGRNIDQYFVGHLTPDDNPDPTALGALLDLPRVLDEHDVQEVIITARIPADQQRWISECCFERGAALFVIPSVIGTTDCRAEPLRVGACTLLRLHPARLEFPALLAKRIFDVVVSAIALVIFVPVMALIGLAIKLESPGPVLYRARRVGLGGKIFDMWKFRSMYEDAEEREGELAHLNIYPGGTFKIQNDPRVTRVGRVLRRTSMDELPQLLNVLIGEMSLVGPRPALHGDLDRYQPHHFERLTVIPGITGPWQVGGRNLVTDFETILGMEKSYIRSWSLLLDAKILVRTLGVVIRGEGAY
ncbi:MAG TPA: sugar transferase, partial [Longimicrobiaceae bacterium]|nr:sugar transferase [Longimicrobiaceae bacterium]